MKFVAISDVHIKEKGDLPYLNFLKFLDHPLSRRADKIFLLGDIFDLLVGGHSEYYEKYHELFEKLSAMALQGKRIYQLEGNHDFHFESLVDLIKSRNGLKVKDWMYLKEPVILKDDNKSIMLAHGDEIEIENPDYQKYRKFIRSRFIYMMANTLVPFRFVDSIGRTASAKSRKINKDRYESDEENEIVKDRFRRIFIEIKERSSIDHLVCGHSHSRDLFDYKNGTYINNGYFPRSKSFTSYENGQFDLIKL